MKRIVVISAVLLLAACGGVPVPETQARIQSAPRKVVHSAQGEAQGGPVQDVGGGQCCFVADEPVCPCF